MYAYKIDIGKYQTYVNWTNSLVQLWFLAHQIIGTEDYILNIILVVSTVCSFLYFAMYNCL